MLASRRRTLRSGLVLLMRGRDAVRRYGIGGTVRQALEHVRGARARRTAARADRDFDRRHGVDTAGVVRLRDLDIESANVVHGIRYESTDPTLFRELLHALPIEYGEFTFVDLGAGKGRTLLLAAERPFRAVIGVEFAAELAEVARQNVETYRGERRCADVRVLCGDAVDFAPPDTPLVLYLFHPFEGPVLRAVIDGVERSLLERPRPIFAVLTGETTAAGLLQQIGFVRLPVGPAWLGDRRGIFAPANPAAGSHERT